MSVEPTTEWGRVLQFPQTDQAQEAPAEQLNAETSAASSGAEVATDTDTRVPERAADAPHRAAHIPDVLKTGWKTAKTGWQATAPVRAHVAYTWTGATDVTGRTFARLMHRDITEAIRQAKAAKDYGLVAELEQQKRASADARWGRIKTQLEITGKLAKGAGITLGALAGLFVAVTACVAIYGAGAQLGEYVGSAGGADWASVWTNGYWQWVTSSANGVANFASNAFALLSTVAPWALGAGAVAGIAALHKTGKNSVNLPEWAQSQATGDESGDMVDETSILGALRNLGIKPLNDAFKAGWGTPQHPARVWEMGLGRDGKGWRCQINLPKQVPVSEVNRKKDTLAHNLGRFPVEVWCSEPRDKAGVLDLWIADPGLLTGPVPDWPLLADLDNTRTDYFAGVPVAVDLRGQEVCGEFAGKNWAVAGMMGSGKSSLVITALLGLLLDPLVEADVFVCAQNGDYELMRPRLRRLVTGAGDDTVEAAMANLRELYEELEVRGEALAEHTRNGDPDAEKVSRRLAERDERLRPRVMVVDECQALFMHEEHGQEAVRLAVLLMNASRKYGITLLFLTPEPSSDSLPRKLITVMTNKACFAIGDQQSNDAILGTSSYKRGISAVGLEPATKESKGDVGTAMTSSGFLPKPGLIRSYFVPRDRHAAIVDRAMRLREEAGVQAAPVRQERRDVLADALEVCGAEETRASHVVAAMGARWAAYAGWGINDLVSALAAEGVKVPSTNRVYPVDPVKLREALNAREPDEE